MPMSKDTETHYTPSLFSHTLISLDHYPHHRAIPTSSHVWIVTPTDLKPFHSQASLQLHRNSSVDGLPNLVSPPALSPIEDDSLNHASGTISQLYSAQKRSRTTSYHPQANGMVERFHRQLKAALKAQPDPDSWMTTLPLILLGIRTALKQDLNSTAAEMVYGTTLRLPGEFFNPLPPSLLADPSDFLTKLKNHFKHIQPTPRDNTKTASIPHNLSTATHVFVRHDAVRKPLQPPYDGPYPIIKCTAKYFTIKLNNRTENISIDRLKPAHLDPTNQCTPAPSQQSSPASPTPQLRPSTQPSVTPTTTNTHTTRSGRRVHFPKYLSRNV